jgi:hypothetical protein
VLSSAGEVADRLREELESLGADDLWGEIVADPNWVVYHPPKREKPLTFSRESRDLRADAQAAGLDADLVDALDPALLQGDLVTVERLSRAAGTGSVSVATLTGITDHHEAVAIPPPTHYLRTGASDRWFRMALPLETASTRVVDVVAVDPDRGLILALSDREGIFRTVDGGATWETRTSGRRA